MKIQIQFEATPKGNCLYADAPGYRGNIIEIYCPVPCGKDVDDTLEEDDERYWSVAPGITDYYGYLTMKRAILDDLKAHNTPTDKIEWWYDTDDGLPADAEAGEAVDLDIDYEALAEVIEE